MKKLLLPLLSAMLLGACTPNDKPLKSQIMAVEGAKTETTGQEPVASAPAAAEAVDMSSAELAEKNIRSALKAAAPELVIETLRPSPYPGLYEVRVKGFGPAYVSPDGKFMLQGELIRISGKDMVNETEAMLTAERKLALAEVPINEMIVYPAKGPRKAAVYVFTDIDCGYCRKLHAEIGEYNQSGIEVRYLAFPRAGYPSPSAAKLEAVWCNTNPLQAMTQSKQGQTVTSPVCKNPVKNQYELGMLLGVRGTPAVFTEGGEQPGGYIPPKDMVKVLGLK